MLTTRSLLNRLNARAQAVAAELKRMPDADSLHDPAFALAVQEQRSDTAQQLLQAAIDQFWSADGAEGIPRQAMLVAAMRQDLHDEIALKIQDGSLHGDYSRCLSEQPGEVDAYALSLWFDELTTAELSGVRVLIIDNGPVLLWIPGHGIESFHSRQQLLITLTEAMNDNVLRIALTKNMELRYQDLLDSGNDPDLEPEPFEVGHWQLLPVNGDGVEHAVTRQRLKQSNDLAYAFGNARLRNTTPEQHLQRINQAVRMPQLWGPEAMLARRIAQLEQQARRKSLPEWFRHAPAADLQRYLQHLQRYDQSRAVLASLLNGAASPEQFAALRLRTRLATDLGYDLDPDLIEIVTRRTLPLTGEAYEVRRSLTELALYGLHPGDTQVGSLLLANTQSVPGNELTAEAYPRLTTAYLAGLIEQLDLRSQFGAFQRTLYGMPGVSRQVAETLRLQVIAQAHAAKLQGHIGDGKEGRPNDLELFEALEPGNEKAIGQRLLVQQLRLNERDTLNNVLVLRKLDSHGKLERLVLFTAAAPRERHFQSFDSERQLLHEVASWSRASELSDYLVEQVAPERRPQLETQLQALGQRIDRIPDRFITYLSHASINDALDSLAQTHIDVQLAEQAVHTPDWYLRASPARRQELVALEDAIEGATGNYQSQAHTRAPDFDAYVHQYASEKLNALLGNSGEPVDPDLVIITSPRESVSYTQMLRDGYDDSLGFLNPSAATQARFSGPEGVDLTALSPQKVAGSVRGNWPSDRYVALLNTTLLDQKDPGYHYRRVASLLITQLQMKYAALRSCLKGHISERQYSWLKNSIERMHINDLQTRRGYPIYPLQFELHNPLIASDVPALGEALDFLADAGSTLLGIDRSVRRETVQGCYLLTPGTERDASQAMLYTPRAADGLEFRALNDFLDTLHTQGMSDYYKDRCRLSANRTLAFLLRDMKKGGSSRPPTLPAAPYADLFTICYNRVLQRKILDVEESTTGRSDMLRQMVWNSIELIATAVTLPFPPASFAVGALLALGYNLKALEAFSEGDREAAASYILTSLLNGLGAYGDLNSGLKGFAGLLRQGSARQARAPALAAIKKLPGRQSADDLQALDLQGEIFHAGTPTPDGYYPLFRGDAQHPETLIATGHFARKDLAGAWQPSSVGTHVTATTQPLKADVSLALNASLENATAFPGTHAIGVHLIDGKACIGLDGLVFQVAYDAHSKDWYIVDPVNPYAFFGRQRVRFNAQDQWEVTPPLQLQGGAGGAGGHVEEQWPSTSRGHSSEAPPATPADTLGPQPSTSHATAVADLDIGISPEGLFSEYEQIQSKLEGLTPAFPRYQVWQRASAAFEPISTKKVDDLLPQKRMTFKLHEKFLDSSRGTGGQIMRAELIELLEKSGYRLKKEIRQKYSSSKIIVFGRTLADGTQTTYYLKFSPAKKQAAGDQYLGRKFEDAQKLFFATYSVDREFLHIFKLDDQPIP